jgi:hypothetical protein
MNPGSSSGEPEVTDPATPKPQNTAGPAGQDLAADLSLVTSATAASLARRLDELAETLDERERRMLARLLASAMDPLERLRFLDQTPMLTSEEWRALGGPGVTETT